MFISRFTGLYALLISMLVLEKSFFGEKQLPVLHPVSDVAKASLL